MEQKVVIFLALLLLHSLQALDASTSIDCGSNNNYTASDGVEWRGDGEFTNSGQNKKVSFNGTSVSEQMGTLRFFTQLKKSCYTVPTPSQVKYLIRAGFYYGNYDGLAKPPTFDLHFDGNRWATVATSMDVDPVFYEVIFAVNGDSINVCLARTRDNEFPFISSLEATPLDLKMYGDMNRNYGWFTSYRVHLGGGSDTIGYPDDSYNRIWKPLDTPDLTTIVADFSSLYDQPLNDPPFLAINKAVEPEPTSTTDSINISLNFTQTNRINYLALYFTEVSDTGGNRSFNVYIDDQDYNITVTTYHYYCMVHQVTTHMAMGPMDITLSPLQTSSYPPLISAIEAYTATDQPLTTGTHRDDLDGLAILTSSFVQLVSWTGEPCLPNDTVWEWLRCNHDDPPRVTSLYLSGYGLEGPLPTFDQMQALEIIDLHDNKLSNEMPDFLGNLPNLRQLNLANNYFSGCMPDTLFFNKNITYNVTGNTLTGDCNGQSREKRKKLNWLGALVIVFIVMFGIYYVYRKKEGKRPVSTAQGTRPNNVYMPTAPRAEPHIQITTTSTAQVRVTQI